MSQKFVCKGKITQPRNFQSSNFRPHGNLSTVSYSVVLAVYLGVLGDIFLRVALNVTNSVIVENTIHITIILQNSALTEMYRGITHIPNKVITYKYQGSNMKDKTRH